MELNNNTQFQDTEFNFGGEEKISFTAILFKHLDYIRFLGSQDTGELMIMQLDMLRLSKADNFEVWISNIQKYQNAVKALQDLLVNYYDDEYNKQIKQVKSRYLNLKNKEILQLKLRCDKVQAKISTWEKERDIINKRFAFVQENKKHQEIFRILLRLISRAKLLGNADKLKTKEK
jgi:hypothetical protein